MKKKVIRAKKIHDLFRSQTESISTIRHCQPTNISLWDHIRTAIEPRPFTFRTLIGATFVDTLEIIQFKQRNVIGYFFFPRAQTPRLSLTLAH